MMKMFVFLLPPELSLTEMSKMSVTPCGSSSLIVSSLSQSISGTHLITPLQVFSVPWGLAVTWQPAKLSSLLTVHIRLWEAVVTWMIKSPDHRRLISLTLPIAVFIALSMREDSLDNGCSSSTERQTNSKRSPPCLSHCPRLRVLYRSACYET